MARDDRRDDYDDYDDRPRAPRGGEMGPLDGMFKNTSMVILILFAICCNGIALILSLIAFFTAKDPTAKSNALTVMIIALVVTGVGIALQVAGVMGGLLAR